MGEMNVYQIVERCQLGDEQAFGLLYTVMRDRLRTVVTIRPTIRR